MQKESQVKYRAALIEKYEQRAFECLALYNYYGKEYKAIDDQCTDMDKKIEAAEARIREIEALPDHHTVENRTTIKALKKDCEDYHNRIASVGELGKKLFERSTTYREEGVRCLEQIEEFKAFTLKTPEEIEADKKVEAPAVPVVAEAEVKE